MQRWSISGGHTRSRHASYHSWLLAVPGPRQHVLVSRGRCCSGNVGTSLGIFERCTMANRQRSRMHHRFVGTALHNILNPNILSVNLWFARSLLFDALVMGCGLFTANL